METREFGHGSFINAKSIEIGKDFKIGSNVKITVRGDFTIGDYSRFGDDVTINAEKVSIGKHFFHYTPGLIVGGGGSQFPEAVFTVGDRCVVHNNYINICQSVTLGNDVGLSPDVDILTHGFWNSILEGYPFQYEGVQIGNGVIVGQRAMILMGCYIADNVVIGANSTVTKSILTEKTIWAGAPARFIRPVSDPTHEEKQRLMDMVVDRYIYLLTLTKHNPEVEYLYPEVRINEAYFNVELRTIRGMEDDDTDKFRDHLRRYGIKIYTERAFLSLV